MIFNVKMNYSLLIATIVLVSLVIPSAASSTKSKQRPRQDADEETNPRQQSIQLNIFKPLPRLQQQQQQQKIAQPATDHIAQLVDLDTESTFWNRLTQQEQGIEQEGSTTQIISLQPQQQQRKWHSPLATFWNKVFPIQITPTKLLYGSSILLLLVTKATTTAANPVTSFPFAITSSLIPATMDLSRLKKVLSDTVYGSLTIIGLLQLQQLIQSPVQQNIQQSIDGWWPVIGLLFHSPSIRSLVWNEVLPNVFLAFQKIVYTELWRRGLNFIFRQVIQIQLYSNNNNSATTTTTSMSKSLEKYLSKLIGKTFQATVDPVFTTLASLLADTPVLMLSSSSSSSSNTKQDHTHKQRNLPTSSSSSSSTWMKKSPMKHPTDSAPTVTVERNNNDNGGISVDMISIMSSDDSEGEEETT